MFCECDLALVEEGKGRGVVGVRDVEFIPYSSLQVKTNARDIAHWMTDEFAMITFILGAPDESVDAGRDVALCRTIQVNERAETGGVGITRVKRGQEASI